MALPGRYVVSIERRGEATVLQRYNQFVSECGGILPRIGDENLELLSCASVPAIAYPTRCLDCHI